MTYPVLHRLLAEADKPDVNEIVQFVQANCQPWIREMKSAVTHRAMWRCGRTQLVPAGEDYVILSPRADRQPRDSSPVAHNLFNKIMATAGMKANRSNSVFVSGGLGDGYNSAQNYGSKCGVVIPIGEFDFAWSNKVYDLYSQIIELGRDIPIILAWTRYGIYDDLEQSVEKLGFELSTNQEFLDIFKQHAQPSYQLNSAAEQVWEKIQASDTLVPVQKRVFEWLLHIGSTMRHLYGYVETAEVIANMWQAGESDPVIAACLEPFVQSIAKSFTDKDLAGGLNSTHEVLILCSKYMFIEGSVWVDRPNGVSSGIAALIK